MPLKKFFVPFFLIICFCSASAQQPENSATSRLDPESKGVFVRVVDVGAGLCCIVRVNGENESRTLLFDTGTYENEDSFGNKGVFAFHEVKNLVPEDEIEWLVHSHEDSDHIAATPQICDRYKIRNILRTGFLRDGTYRARSREAIEKEIRNDGAVDHNQAESTRLSPGAQFAVGEAKFTVLSGFGKPLAPWWSQFEEPRGDEINSISIVLRLDYRGRSVLFTGDAVGKHSNSPEPRSTERYLLDNQDKPNRSLKSDVIIASHHGGNDASSQKFVEAVQPTHVIFSSGSKWKHPTWRTVSRFLALDSVDYVFRTDFGDKKKTGEWFWGSDPHSNRDRPGDDHVDILLTPQGRVFTFYTNPELRGYLNAR